MKPPHPDPNRPEAVAIVYDPADQAPRVVAKGYGNLAESIVRIAHEHGLYVHESPELVGLLMQVDLDARIPPQLYVAIAELLAWLYVLDADAGAPSPTAQHSGYGAGHLRATAPR